VNNESLAFGRMTEPTQDIPFTLKNINLFPTAIGDDYHQTVMGNATQDTFKDLEVFILYRQDNGHFLLNFRYRLTANTLHSGIVPEHYRAGIKLKSTAYIIDAY
jgi:hypothetical protein